MGVWNFTLVLLLAMINLVSVQAMDKGIFFLEARQGGKGLTPEENNLLDAFGNCASMNWAASIGQPCFSKDEANKEGERVLKAFANTKQSTDQALGSVRKYFEKQCAEEANCANQTLTCVCNPDTTCSYKPDSSKDCKKEFTSAIPALVKMAKEKFGNGGGGVGSGTTSGPVLGPQFESVILTILLAVLVLAHIY